MGYKTTVPVIPTIPVIPVIPAIQGEAFPVAQREMMPVVKLGNRFVPVLALKFVEYWYGLEVRRHWSRFLRGKEYIFILSTV